MGGKGSGGHNKIGDAERKRRGSYRADESEAVAKAAAEAKVIAGPWLSVIPDPTMPLNEVGRKKYDELTRALFDQNKLTSVTQMYAEAAATCWQEQHTRMSTGKPVPAFLIAKLQSALAALKIAEDAAPITNPEAKVNRFAQSGFSNRRNSPVRLRKAAAAGS